MARVIAKLRSLDRRTWGVLAGAVGAVVLVNLADVIWTVLLVLATVAGGGTFWLWQRRAGKAVGAAPRLPAPPDANGRHLTPARVEAGSEAAQLAEQLLAEGRFALLLRPLLAAELDDDFRDRAFAQLEQQMSVVPRGTVLVRPFRATYEAVDVAAVDFPVEIEALYLDRFPVTNRDFQKFVAQGAYGRSSLWDSHIWPAVGQFVDRSGCPGPRFWRNGTFPPGEADLPVVGVSWYEAMAYARWVGKRLPTDAEWVKAAAWPVSSTGSVPAQRRFPWGDLLDRRLANLWGAGPGKVADVHAYGGGANPAGVQQLVGNTWEWTASGFGVWDEAQRNLELTAPMKCIRGGAFDTYFESQATTEFQSGECPMERRHNIGFRCALGFGDVVHTAQAQRHRSAEAVPSSASKSPVTEHAA